MMLKKLREKRKWSQEQLATMAGLSIRTVQRIESGHRASLESLKSLASVLEVNMSTLEQEIAVIDKTTEEWKKLPLLFRLNFVGSEIEWLGLSKRRDWIRSEMLISGAGCVTFLLGFVFEREYFVAGFAMLAIGYAMSLVTRLGDKYSIW
jgi:transcriptional regulator with XRE-family HTH domain